MKIELEEIKDDKVQAYALVIGFQSTDKSTPQDYIDYINNYYKTSHDSILTATVKFDPEVIIKQSELDALISQKVEESKK